MRVAINGLGRIGRLVLKLCLEKKINVVAVNDLAPVDSIVYLLKHDSVYGVYDKKIEKGNKFIQVGGKQIAYFSEKNPENLPWKKLRVDVVVESTGVFRDRDGASKHLVAGAKKVVISAPGKNPDITIVLGVNDNKLKKNHKIISLGSCTTNCLTPIIKVLDDSFKIKKGFMTTVHAYTNDQKILDLAHKKFRRGRAAAVNIIPTTSGATTAVVEVLPSLKGKLDGLAMRVPVPCGSIVDFVAELGKKVSREEVNDALRKAANRKLKGVLRYSEDELVSSDIVGDRHSSIVDGLSTQVIGNMVKVLSWYDNEFGYSNRVVDFIQRLKCMI